MEKLKRALTGRDEEEDEERGFVAQAMDASTLSWSTRIKGFCGCFILGVLLSITGSVILALGGSLTTFGVLYTFGNITSLLSTCFLMGPVSQIKNMFAKTRAIATVVMLLSLVLTLCAAFWWKKGVLALVFIVIQFLAMTWYSISYIPFARDAILKCFNGILT